MIAITGSLPMLDSVIAYLSAETLGDLIFEAFFQTQRDGPLSFWYQVSSSVGKLQLEALVVVKKLQCTYSHQNSQ